MKDNEFCVGPEGVRCPDIFDQCGTCKWVQEEMEKLNKDKEDETLS